MSANFTVLSHLNYVQFVKLQTWNTTLLICDQIEEMLDSMQGEFEFENKAKIVSYLLVNT